MQEVCYCWFYKETPPKTELHISNKTKVFPEVNQPDKANLFLLSWPIPVKFGLFLGSHTFKNNFQLRWSKMILLHFYALVFQLQNILTTSEAPHS